MKNETIEQNKILVEKVKEILLESNYKSDRHLARTLVYEENTRMFNNWDEELLGDKQSKLDNTKVYKEEFKVESKNNYETRFGCFNADCVDIAEDLIKEGLNPAILNLASNYRPGGGYDKGCGAQEESLCYASTLSQSLYQYGTYKSLGVRESNVKLKENAYPLDINYGGIYSKDVCFFRNNMTKYYSLKDKPFNASVITVASLDNRRSFYRCSKESIYFNEYGYLLEEGIKIEKNKIRTIYRIGLENNHDSLVLGALGCGVYNVLPIEISKLFMDVLNEDEFKNKYKKIVFAIYEVKNKDNEIIGEKGKFKPFYDLFK